jgi:hypothetical protein
MTSAPRTATRLLLLAAALVGGPVFAADPPEFSLTIEAHRFAPEEIRVKAGTPFILIIANKDATPEEFDSPDLRMEKVLPGNKTMRLRMPGLKPGTYRFMGEYNAATAKGRIVAE